ncbi:MAG TPA: c-type cytochrome [Agriterribacter sp.]|nr:c-type cytochrome [Agriterribacter sp.]
MEVWAQRSVLDLKPRMFSLALDPECYVAYDLEHGALYKAWKGGISWEGTVYNETKVAQPTSWGKDYVRNDSTAGMWMIEKNGKPTTVAVRFLGYRFQNNQVYLKYRLTTPTDTVEVEERPEFIRDDNGNPGLERMFNTSGVGPQTTVLLKTQSGQLPLKSNSTTISKTFYAKLPPQSPPVIDPREAGNLGKYWIERSDCFTCHRWDEKNIGPAFKQIAEKYAQHADAANYLVNKIKAGGSGVWGESAMNSHPNLGEDNLRAMVKYILSLSDNKSRALASKSIEKPKKIIAAVQPRPRKPGFGAPLAGLHPSYDVQTLHLPGTEYKVGGLAFMPDGRLIVTTWTPEGSVYMLEGVETGDSSKIKAKKIAWGLYEPLGVAVVNSDIFVLQKHELTQLIDRDGDGITDEYKAICNGFGVSADFHEFAFGLVYKDDHFYANLSLPMRLMDNEKPHPDRGRTVKIAMDGSFEWVNSGLRQPNGIGLGIDDEIFTTDNQGQWLPANKFIHVRQGDFLGMRWGLPDSLSHLKMVPPAVWLPEDEIANSPSEPALMRDGPYNGQMIFGDVSHGGIKRVFLEKVNGLYQGAVFRFTQGLEVGINRIRRGPDGAWYVGGTGMGGGWSWKGTNHGLQRMKYNGKSTFEMLAIRSTPNGFEIEFTEPLAGGQGNSPADYAIQQWWYLPTETYGGPKMDVQSLKVRQVQVLPDRKKVILVIPGLKKEHIVKFDLNENLRSANGQELWSSEAWYTLNHIPQSTH